MKTNPLIGIMMPVYNSEKTLPLATNSLKAQTYKNWKCYIVNDGSSDKTREILDDLDDPRFVVIHFEKNKGRPYARQAILDVVEGEYLAFLDADDFYHSKKLELQVNILLENEVSLVSCGNASFDAQRELKSVRGLGLVKQQIYKKGTTPIMAMRTSMILTKIAKSIRFDYRLQHAQDTDFLTKYLNVGQSYIVQDEVLYYYSEYESVTSIKILKTYYFHLIQLLSNQRGFTLVISFFLKLIKFIILCLIIPFTGVEYILNKRGRKVNKREEEIYKEELKANLYENNSRNNSPT